ncbi:ribosome recycling factor [Phormidium yuhuli AB48]|uniref:Ribosome-recycling factor n=2 Tax=Phormidium TaxID=1198 RepID=A0ABY5AQX8_9CYAN|nr:ribosome recycling factor [Phormidium yuhuli]USR90558.1 ribosome recycling factor [Phormidium yuhuli AB48]
MMLPDLEERMKNAVDATLRAFNSIRTGRANAAILDRVMVDYYNSPTPLKSLAGISTPDSTTILIQPFDPGSLATIEKAISMSDLGMMPNNDGKVIRLNVPPLTSERRQEFVKLAAKYAEEGKVSVRNARRDAIDEVRKQEKNSDISEDESRDLQDQIQGLTDKYTDKIDKLLAEKEEDITTV